MSKFPVVLNGFSCDAPECTVSVIVMGERPPDRWLRYSADDITRFYCSEEHARADVARLAWDKTDLVRPYEAGAPLSDVLAAQDITLSGKRQ